MSRTLNGTEYTVLRGSNISFSAVFVCINVLALLGHGSIVYAFSVEGFVLKI